MTIVRRLGIGYAAGTVLCLAVVAWLGYHEFVEEPEQYAARGLPGLHRDTLPEISTVAFLGMVPLLLGIGWWWLRRMLAPLRTLADAAEAVHSQNLQHTLPRSHNGDEVDRLTAAFNDMTRRLAASIGQIHGFTLHASHELKTPLTLMRMQLETALREHEPAHADQLKWVHAQLDEIARLTKIVDSLTLLTVADAGLLRSDFRPVPFEPLVREAFADASYLAEAQGLTATLGECAPVEVAGDRHRLRQLLLILLDNAVKYNLPGGRISVSLRHSGSTAELRVTNTGIPPKSFTTVFERFVRGENAQGQVEGCGLGLSLARSIAEAHGGTIAMLPGAAGEISVKVDLPALGAPVATNA